MKIEIKVVPNSKKFLIKQRNEVFVIHLKSEAKRGKANNELVKKLTKILKKEVTMVRGLKNENKVVDIDGEKREVLELFQRRTSN